jgi:hypothetical protein
VICHAGGNTFSMRDFFAKEWNKNSDAKFGYNLEKILMNSDKI